MNARVTAVIPCHNLVNLTYDLLHSIAMAQPPELARIVVVDNGSTDPTVLQILIEIQDWFHNKLEFVIVRNGANVGFGKACNQGIRLGWEDSTHFCVFNNDVLVAPGWLTPLLECLEKEPDVGMARSQFVDIECTPDQYRRIVWPDRPLEYYSRDRGIPWLFRKECLEETGLFDEQFAGTNFEDVDLLYRLAREDWDWVTVLNVPSYHYPGSLTQTLVKQKDGRDYLAENKAKFFAKWPEAADFRHIEEIHPVALPADNSAG
jgi:GT2 family glycosyltransferase